jgi:hypothetical protein
LVIEPNVALAEGIGFIAAAAVGYSALLLFASSGPDWQSLAAERRKDLRTHDPESSSFNSFGIEHQPDNAESYLLAVRDGVGDGCEQQYPITHDTLRFGRRR